MNIIEQIAKQCLINEGKYDPSMSNPDDHKQDNQFKDADEYEQRIKDEEKYRTELKKESDINSEDKIEDCEVKEGEEYDFAKKLGYRGEEKQVADWLKGEYGKWRKIAFETFLNIANGDEEKATEWFDRYIDLSGQMYGTRSWSKKENKFIDQKQIKNELEAELGDNPVVKELMQRLEDKWAADRKSLSDFYATSDLRGGWTGD